MNELGTHKKRVLAEAPRVEKGGSFKRRLFAGVVRHRRALIAAFVVCALMCVPLKQLVGVDYDMNDYLPADAGSTVALDTMHEQFGGAVPNARVMVKGVDVCRALDYKAQIQAVDGVTSVTWLDDATSLSVPLEMADPDTVETYYKDGNALFSVAIENDKRIDACNEIRAIVGDSNCMAGSAVSTAVATQSTVKEIGVITVCAIAFILLVLILTTGSWIEPLIVLTGLGVAVVINSGTNIVFDTISFVTNAAGAILQVAIALDFCVFLLHRYAECRGTRENPEVDMVDALCKCSTAIISSACTVIIGFLALTVMRFQIGPDLGFALAKGIFISLLTVFLFMPGLFVAAEKLIGKTTHRPFVPPMTKLARAVQKACVPLAVVFLVLPVPCFLASTSHDVSFYYGASHIFNETTKLGADTAEITQAFGDNDAYVLMVPKGDTAREAELSAALHDVPQVKSIISYVDAASPAIPSAMAGESTLSQLEGSDYARMVVSVSAKYEGDATFNLVDEIRSIAQDYYPDEWLLAGEGVSTTDLMQTISEDKEKVDVIAMLAVLAVLVLATRSLSLPVILVFVIETSIWLNFAVPYFTGQPEFYIAYLIVSTIQLGVTVDYAILITDRYKEDRRSMGKKQALRVAIESCTAPVCTSGIVLTVVGFLLSAVSSHGILAQLGHFLGVGVLMSLIAVIFVLPGFLYACDGLIAKTTVRARFVPPHTGEGPDGHVLHVAESANGEVACKQ